MGDKQFAARALDELHTVVLEDNNIAVIQIVSGYAQVDDRARKVFRRFRDELAKAGIIAEWRLRTDDFTHDRYIISQGLCMNVPPVNTIFEGSFSEFLPSAAQPNFAEWWTGATPMLVD